MESLCVRFLLVTEQTSFERFRKAKDCSITVPCIKSTSHPIYEMVNDFLSSSLWGSLGVYSITNY